MKFFLVILIFLNVSASSQTIPRFTGQKPLEKKAGKSNRVISKKESILKGVLLIVPDADCTVSIDGEDQGFKKADVPFKLTVLSGEHFIICITADGKDKWSQTTTVTSNDQKIVRPELASIQNNRLQKEQLTAGADQNARNLDEKKRNATNRLSAAIAANFKTVSVGQIEQYINDGADIKSVKSWNCSVLYFALDNNSVELMKLLESKGTGIDCWRSPEAALQYAITGVDNDAGNYLFATILKNPVNVNARDDRGSVPLDHAIISIWLGIGQLSASANGKQRSLQRILALIEKGADVNIRDSEGNTPLMSATDADRLDIARLLLEKGANANARNNYGQTVLKNAYNVKLLNNGNSNEFVNLIKQYGGK